MIKLKISLIMCILLFSVQLLFGDFSKKPDSEKQYTVVKNDTISNIAYKYYKDSDRDRGAHWIHIYEYSIEKKLINSDKQPILLYGDSNVLVNLFVGQTLVIPYFKDEYPSIGDILLKYGFELKDDGNIKKKSEETKKEQTWEINNSAINNEVEEITGIEIEEQDIKNVKKKNEQEWEVNEPIIEHQAEIEIEVNNKINIVMNIINKVNNEYYTENKKELDGIIYEDDMTEEELTISEISDVKEIVDENINKMSITEIKVNNKDAFNDLINTIDNTARKKQLKKWYEKDGEIGKVFEITTFTIDDIIEEAKTYIGTKFKYGGLSKLGIDCSGLFVVVFDKFGIKMPHSADMISKYGQLIVNTENLEKGDLLFFTGTSKKNFVSHMGIYLGNGEMLHTSRSKGVAIDSYESSYWKPKYIFAKRLFKNKE